jgi:hypothetical protein
VFTEQINTNKYKSTSWRYITESVCKFKLALVLNSETTQAYPIVTVWNETQPYYINSSFTAHSDVHSFPVHIWWNFIGAYIGLMEPYTVADCTATIVVVPICLLHTRQIIHRPFDNTMLPNKYFHYSWLSIYNSYNEWYDNLVNKEFERTWEEVVNGKFDVPSWHCGTNIITYVCTRGGPQKPALAPRPLKIYCAYE